MADEGAAAGIDTDDIAIVDEASAEEAIVMEAGAEDEAAALVPDAVATSWNAETPEARAEEMGAPRFAAMAWRAMGTLEVRSVEN